MNRKVVNPSEGFYEGRDLCHTQSSALEMSRALTKISPKSVGENIGEITSRPSTAKSSGDLKKGNGNSVCLRK